MKAEINGNRLDTDFRKKGSELEWLQTYLEWKEKCRHLENSQEAKKSLRQTEICTTPEILIFSSPEP